MKGDMDVEDVKARLDERREIEAGWQERLERIDAHIRIIEEAAADGVDVEKELAQQREARAALYEQISEWRMDNELMQRLIDTDAELQRLRQKRDVDQ